MEIANQYLSFLLDNELYGFNISSIREVLEYEQVTKVPGAVESILGIINVRGHVVPVTDLRKKLNIGEVKISLNTCIIISEIERNNEKVTMGVMVDAVQEVIEIDNDNIESAPTIGSRINTKFINGIGKINDKFIVLLDVKEIFSFEELEKINEVSKVSKENLNLMEQAV